MGRALHLMGISGSIAALLALLVSACGSGVNTLSVNPAEVTVSKVGEQVQLETEPRDRRGAKVSGVILNYRSRDPSVATVSSTGLVKAVSHGVTMIDVTVEGTDAMEFVRVVVRLPEKVVVRPTTGSVNIGGITKLTADVLDHDGKSFGNVSVDWSSSDESKATVEKGSVTGIDEGDAVITAKAMGLEGQSKLRVVWAPGQKALIEAEKRFKARTSRGRSQRSSGGGGEKSNVDPRLGMFQ